ncbi:MAG TPA: hypothetical protein VJX16_07430 [Terriglobales bacterium]|nr:hypothetical protein [Terriglobales bacterium]
MNTVLSIDRAAAAVAKQGTMRAAYSLGFDASMIRITQGDIGNSGHRRKCGNS